MAIWIEIHCDIRLPGQDPDDILTNFCYSDRNDNIMALFHNGRKIAGKAYAKLAEDAKESGWTYTRADGWACPNCKTVQKPKGEAT